MNHLLVEGAPLDVELGPRSRKLAFGGLQPLRRVDPGRERAEGDSENECKCQHRVDER